MGKREYRRKLPSRDKLVDALDYDVDVGTFTRRKSGKLAGYPDRKGYIRIWVDGAEYFAHRLAWLYIYEEDPPEVIDHVNMDKADNRISNLRAASPAENNANCAARATGTSGLKGVTWHAQRRKWKAAIQVNRKSIHIGLFTDKRDAHAAYVAKANEIYGEFARAN